MHHSKQLWLPKAGAALLAGLIVRTACGALMLTTLARFDGTNGASGTTLVQTKDGVLYGASEAGGEFELGTVFRLTPNGILSAVASFDGTNGAFPQSGLIQDEIGALYGTTIFGGTSNAISAFDSAGTVYRVTTNGSITVLHAFNSTDGAHPVSMLTRGSDGYLYGTTTEGGPYTNANGVTLGTIFRINTNGSSFATLAAFNGTNGAGPIAELIEGTDGNFYGTTTRGGTADLGTIFRVTTNGSLTTLVSFRGTNGARPYAGLVQHRDGNFYGTTREGGDSDNGTFFRMDTNGNLTLLASFNSTVAVWPRATLVAVDDSSFYGVAQFAEAPPTDTLGAIFEAGTNGTLSRLVSSFNSTRGTQPFCTLLKGANGLYYGTTDRTVFRLDHAIAPQILTFTKTNDWVALSWSSVPEQTYRLEQSSSLAAGSWSPLHTIIANSTNTSFDYPELDPQHFYRAVLVP